MKFLFIFAALVCITILAADHIGEKHANKYDATHTDRRLEAQFGAKARGCRHFRAENGDIYFTCEGGDVITEDEMQAAEDGILEILQASAKDPN